MANHSMRRHSRTVVDVSAALQECAESSSWQSANTELETLKTAENAASISAAQASLKKLNERIARIEAVF